MKLYKAELIFISLEIILLLTAIVFSEPEIETGEHYGCNELRLNCSDRPGHVVTGFIYGGHTTTTGTPPKKKPKGASCPAPDAKTDCQAPTISGRLREEIRHCLWRSAVCLLPVGGQQLGHPCLAKSTEYLVAKQFKCVKQSSVVDVCSESGKASPLAMTGTNSEIYLLSKNYPDVVASRLDCTVSVIQSKPGVRLRFRSVFMDLHPRTRRSRSSSEEAEDASCAVDYVQLTPSGEEAETIASRSFFFFCGSDVVDFVSNATTEVRFVSGPDDKHYGGFVIRVTAEDGYRDNRIPKSNGSSAAVASTAVRGIHPVGTRLVTLAAFATWLRLLCCCVGQTSPVDR